VPALIVGLTIVAFGTSAPELVVGVQSVLKGAGELAAGNVIGSNIANVLLALGIPALIMAIPTNMTGVARNTLVCLFATILFIVLAFIAKFTSNSELIFWQGAILFAGIVLYLAWMFRLSKAGIHDPILDEMTEILIAGTMGISETIIGLTIVAIGTSLPEIATVVVASYRGHSEVAIGNVLGSNVFNLFAVMGATAMTGPVPIEKELLTFDVWVMLASSTALLIFVLTRQPIGKKTGVIFLIGYVLYMLALIRGVM